MVTEVQADLHAGIPTSDDQNIFAREERAGLVGAGVENGPHKLVLAFNLRDNLFRILTRGHDEPLAQVLGDVPLEPPSEDPPAAEGGVELGAEDGGAESRGDVEVESVGVEVGQELVLGGVVGEVGGEGEERELAELFWEVEAKAVVGPELPH